MKRRIAWLLALLLGLSLAACGKTEANAPVPTAQPEAEEPAQAASSEAGESKVLVVYFSSANTVNADAVSEATPMVEGLGATGYLASLIQKETGADLAKITPEADYPTDYNGTTDAAKTEQDRDERPGYTLDVNPEDYYVIFVGYPIWWYTRPMLLYSFFDACDFSGKTLIPFCTHAGSRDSGTFAEIREAEPDATVLDGLVIAARSENAVARWAKEQA